MPYAARPTGIVRETIAIPSGYLDPAPGELICSGAPDGVGPVVPGDVAPGRIGCLSEIETTVR